MGNKDIEFVIERMYFLERFMLNISEIDYLKKCDEMKIFIRHELSGSTMEIDKLLQKMTKPTNKKLLSTYIKAFKIDRLSLNAEK